eukprot:gene37863-45996_t
MERVQVVVVGGGSVGLSIARQLVLTGRSCLLLEKNAACGLETSSRSSEVLHAGLYYPKATLKTKLCISGRDLLVHYMRDRGIQYKLCGKIVVSVKAEDEQKLRFLLQNGHNNGLHRLEMWGEEMLRRLEPSVHATAALYSPYSGIFDSSAVLQSLQNDFESNNGILVTNCCFLGARLDGEEFVVSTSSGEVRCAQLVNSGGMLAQDIARKIYPLPPASIPPLYLAKGQYFKLRGSRGLLSHLVYPIPEPGGLGIHATLDLQGAVRFGPDVTFLSPRSRTASCDPHVFVDGPRELSYEVEEEARDRFLQAASAYLPCLRQRKEDLLPDYAGIRPKLRGPAAAESFCDFSVQGPKEHGVRGLVCLYGVESPGWTSSLALGNLVCAMLA